ncbi:hypothetical protein F7725_007035 [Dissostichus mawsoni]|uniref:Nucleolar protein 16 n=1 Tax=Dissostichus mawsoni TaxID=36200 RepID=A0A7J5XWK8_DISMA|nr:hypothetical protein F7725_007035 [Dissostichus mawsoni]
MATMFSSSMLMLSDGLQVSNLSVSLPKNTVYHLLPPPSQGRRFQASSFCFPHSPVRAAALCGSSPSAESGFPCTDQWQRHLTTNTSLLFCENREKSANMPKAKKSGKRKKFNYNLDRKKMKKQAIKKCKPRIENSQIRNAWDDKKSTSRNLQDMGLAFDPNRSLPIQKKSLTREDRVTKAPVETVTKPYVVNQLEEEANRLQKDSKTLSSDLIEYAQYMIREHKDNFKIKRKLIEYQRCHKEHYNTFMSSLAPQPIDQ